VTLEHKSITPPIHHYTTTHTHTHPLNGPFSGTTHVSRYQKDKTNLDFTGAKDSEWQWHQLGHMQVCTSLQTDNHTSTPPLSFLQAGCPSCHPTNSVKALKATITSPSVQLTNPDFTRRVAAEVEMVVLSVCIDCGLYIVGSSLNGFGTSQSDMDLCLMVSHLEVLLSPLSEVIVSLSPILLAAGGIVFLTCPLVSACVLLACMHAYVCVPAEEFCNEFVVDFSLVMKLHAKLFFM